MIERIERSRGRADQPQNLKPHPLAARVRPPTEEEFQALKASIGANGLRDPIITRYEGFCLNGNSRLRACIELGRTDELEVEDLDAHDDPIDFVLDANYHRRHLSSADRSDTATRLRELGLTQAQIGEKLRLSHQTVGRDLKRPLVRKPGTGLNVQHGHSETAGQGPATDHLNHLIHGLEPSSTGEARSALRPIASESAVAAADGPRSSTCRARPVS